MLDIKTTIKVDYIYRSKDFNNAYKKLVKDHRFDVINKLNDIIEKLMYRNEITKESHNHPLKNGVFDIHITGDVILLYRYKDNALLLTLELHNLTNHRDLNKNLNKIGK